MATLENTAVSRPRPPDFVPGYRLEKLVGKGGMGEVHKATQLSLGRTVAIKLLATELAKDQSFITRFDKESAALAALSHPNIVSIVDKGKNDATYYIVMEFVDGPSMREVMRSPLLDTTEALRMMLSICGAIDYAHGRGVIHRDLKPENILFDEQAGGIAKVSDFGLAGFVDETATAAQRFHVTETHVSMGTSAYMAPEQRVDAKNADHRADIYSLGVILYELLVGEVPMGNFDLPSVRKPELDRRLDTIVARCLKPVAADRYQRVSELIAELQPLVPITHSVPAGKTTQLERLKFKARVVARQTGRVVAAALALLAVLVLIAAWARNENPVERQPPGIELTTDFGAKWPLTAPGRLDPPQDKRQLVLGDGPDTLALVALGRKPELQGGKVRFPHAEGASAGRVVVDADLEGDALRFSAGIDTEAPNRGTFTPFWELFAGPTPVPKSALLLTGEPGRYVALLVSGSDESPVLEWALGNARRGLMSSPTRMVGKGPHRLELQIDESGQLTAYVGAEKNRRMVGDPLELGKSWRKAFGEMPKAALGCLDGACTFASVKLAVERSRPPPPPPPPPVVATPPPSPPATVRATPPKRTPPPARQAPVKKPKRGRSR